MSALKWKRGNLRDLRSVRFGKSTRMNARLISRIYHLIQTYNVSAEYRNAAAHP